MSMHMKTGASNENRPQLFKGWIMLSIGNAIQKNKCKFNGLFLIALGYPKISTQLEIIVQNLYNM